MDLKKNILFLFFLLAFTYYSVAKSDPYLLLTRLGSKFRLKISKQESIRFKLKNEEQFVTGYIESYGADLEIQKLPKLNKAYQITLEIGKDPVIKALIESIHFEKNGRIILTPKIGNEKIIIDHLDELSEKLADLKDFYRQLARTNSWGKFDEIDISYKNQVVARNLEKP